MSMASVSSRSCTRMPVRFAAPIRPTRIGRVVSVAYKEERGKSEAPLAEERLVNSTSAESEEEFRSQYSDLAERLQARWDRLQSKKTVVAAIVTLLGGTWIVNSVLGNVNGLPLFSRAFKFVGLIVSGNFAWQYLVLDDGRKELKSIVKEKYAGFRDLVEDFPGGGATTSVYDEEDTTITSRPPITDPLAGGPRSVLGVPPIPGSGSYSSGAASTPLQE